MYWFHNDPLSDDKLLSMIVTVHFILFLQASIIRKTHINFDVIKMYEFILLVSFGAKIVNCRSDVEFMQRKHIYDLGPIPVNSDFSFI